MKTYQMLTAVLLTSTTSVVLAGGVPPPPTNIPEPSTLGLFAATVIAIAIVTRLKK